LQSGGADGYWSFEVWKNKKPWAIGVAHGWYPVRGSGQQMGTVRLRNRALPPGAEVRGMKTLTPTMALLIARPSCEISSRRL
jgi:hypothetical protein